MNQILNIFRKDTRRFWIEILLVFLVLAYYVIHAPARWHPYQFSGGLQLLDSVMSILVPAAWWLLIARVIHAESLVGENQFWLTRPYEWKKLLTAKILFIFAWVCVPSVIAQALVLVEAGFSPFSHASSWFFMLSVYGGFVILPLVAIAAVTANFARMTLTLFGVLAVVVGCVVAMTAPTHGYESMVPYAHHFLIVAVLIVGALIVIPLQYATRRVWLSRALIAGVTVLAVGVALVLSAMRDGEIDRQFPAAAAAGSPVQLAFVPNPLEPMQASRAERPGMLYIDIPVEFSGVAEGSAVEADDVKVSLDGADGAHWAAPWWTTRPMRYLPGTHRSIVAIMISREQYEHFKAAPATLHLALAVTELRAATETTAAISAEDFLVDGFGICSTHMMYRFDSQLLCRSPLGSPPLTYITATWSHTPCSGTQPAADQQPTAASWEGAAYVDPLVSGLSVLGFPFVNLYPHASNGHTLENTNGIALCMGTPVHFTRYDVTGRSQAYLTIPNFTLPPER